MNVQKVKKLIPLISIGLFTGALIYSLIQLGFNEKRDRRIFYFNSYDKSSKIVEVRYLSKNPIQGKVACYVDDILLGPLTNRCRRLFPRGTSVDFCIEKEGLLHLGLSKDALKFSDELKDFNENVKLLKYNIVKNFTNFDKIYIYVDGHEIP